MLPRLLPGFSRVLGCVVAAGVLAVGLAGPAAAHVSVNPEEGVQGDWTKLAFSVPNEEEKADTVEVEVKFPTDPAFTAVRVKPHPGWTADVTETGPDQAVTAVTWTAEAGTGIAPGEFDEFEVSVGPLPEQESVEFPATQTYDDGTVVKWDQPMPASGEEPEHPAPSLTLVAASEAGEAGHQHGGADQHATEQTADDEAAVSQERTTRASSATSVEDTTARTLGGLGLAVGVLCLIVLVFNAAAGSRRKDSAE